VVLYVYTIQQQRFLSSVETYQRYLDAAIRCQSQLSNISGPDSLVARYCLVLEELRLEVLRSPDGAQGQFFSDQEGTMAFDMGAISEESMNTILYAPVAYPDVYRGDFVGFWPGLNDSLGNMEDLTGFEPYMVSQT